MKRAPWWMCVALIAACGSEVTVEEAEVDRNEGGETEVVVIREEVPAEDDGVGHRAIAEMAPTEGSAVSGTVVFTQQEGSLKVRVRLSGFQAGSSHGFHIHETGDCSAADGSSAGGHFNPEGNDHDVPPDEPRHAGDMGNVAADADGNVEEEMTFTDITLENANAIVGKAVIVHADLDDGSQPTGNAGARAACGVIRLENAEDGAGEEAAMAPARSSAAADEEETMAP